MQHLTNTVIIIQYLLARQTITPVVPRLQPRRLDSIHGTGLVQLYEVMAVEPLPPWAGMVVYYDDGWGRTRGVISDNKVVEEAGERRRWLGEIADVERSVVIRRQVQGAARDGGGGRRRMVMGVMGRGSNQRQGLVPAHLCTVPL